MKTKTIKWFSRVAMMLLMTMLTTATAWADDVNLTENTNETEGTAERWYVNIPKTGENKLTLTDASITFFKVYDNGGGPQNHYDNDCDGSLVLTAPEGCVLRLSGTIITEKGYDYLTVYDGNAKDDKKVLLNKVSSSSSGAETTIDAVTSTGQSMTLYFHSDNAVKYFGLNLTVTVVNLSEKFTITVNNPEAGGTIEASVGGTVAAQAAMTDVVTLTATPASGYLLSSVSVLDADSNPIAVDCNFSTNIATFTMPRSAVTVTPTFTDTWTAEGGFFINMPKAGDKLITIPTGMQSFKVYDDGGATGNYSYNCDGTLTLTAPEGYVLQLSGSIRTENTRDNLTVYDGSDNSGTVLIDALYSYSNNNERAIPTVNSTGQSLTLYFYSDGSDNFAGLDLTATLVSTSTDYDITLNLGQFTTADARIVGLCLCNSLYNSRLAKDGLIAPGDYLKLVVEFYNNNTLVNSFEKYLVDYTGSDLKMLNEWTEWDISSEASKNSVQIPTFKDSKFKLEVKGENLKPCFCLDNYLISASVTY